MCYHNNTRRISVNMTFKKLLLICSLFLVLPCCAKDVVNNKLDYINLDYWKNYNDEILINHMQTLYQNNHDLRIAALKTKQAEENIRYVTLPLTKKLPVLHPRDARCPQEISLRHRSRLQNWKNLDFSWTQATNDTHSAVWVSLQSIGQYSK